jgi:hypothetical protein
LKDTGVDQYGKLLNAKVFITVKAYPKPSGSYEELVCTAGLLHGEKWIRIYPVPFRLLDDQSKYPKYSWIQLDLERRSDKDFRPESYRPLRGIHEEITVLERIPTTNNWRERKSLVLKDVYYSMDVLIRDAYSDRITSLATLKPAEILDVQVEQTEREWPAKWQNYLIQHDLFETTPDGKRRPIRKVPYDFSYVFRTEDNKIRKLKIEDWELGALYWRCIRKTDGDEAKTKRLVMNKYLSLSRNDIYLFLGTTLKYHQRNVPNPFIIIGVFYPPKDPQIYLF